MEINKKSDVPQFPRIFGYTYTFVRDNPKIGRNEPCPCGSGKKYKKCCLKIQDAEYE